MNAWHRHNGGGTRRLSYSRDKIVYVHLANTKTADPSIERYGYFMVPAFSPSPLPKDRLIATLKDEGQDHCAFSVPTWRGARSDVLYILIKPDAIYKETPVQYGKPQKDCLPEPVRACCPGAERGEEEEDRQRQRDMGEGRGKKMYVSGGLGRRTGGEEGRDGGKKGKERSRAHPLRATPPAHNPLLLAIKPFAQPPYTTLPAPVPAPISYEPLPPPRPAAIAAPVWQDRTIASAKLRLLEYSAFMETQRDRETYKHLFVHIGPSNPSYNDPALESIDFWADLSSDIEEGSGSFYGVSSQYSGTENITISVSTKVCSFGILVVEKVETEYAHMEGGNVLENFTILQVVSNRETQETLLCIAFVFEVSTSEHGAQYHVYRLVND
ncbi:transcriptional enhancer factor TEF-5-like protein [Lates japonicus]|uniref:Transcriptional enhancer factor TEF-5-like protein n=1 Tax=Lates japonicus TaxID=270547 RepID=A0AAD3QVA0_LATJO|nr:transcriptional enhancer factor TEF-5-like protein [Lates japonicus]